jgi:hypothetical protein
MRVLPPRRCRRLQVRGQLLVVVKHDLTGHLGAARAGAAGVLGGGERRHAPLLGLHQLPGLEEPRLRFALVEPGREAVAEV